MIDWLTCRVPVTLPAPIDDGCTIRVDRAGAVERRIPHRLKVAGSFSSSISVRAPSTSELEVSGNPVKWLQGHNLYGPSDPVALLWATLGRLETIPDVLPCPLAEMGLHGPESLADAIVTRVDCTAMLTLDTPGDVLGFLRAAYASGRVEHRGRGVMRGDTLVFGDAAGKTFARWQIVLYAKGQEVADHPLPVMMMQDREVIEWTNRCLRAEVRLGRLELAKLGLRNLRGWNSAATRQQWADKMARIDFNAGGQSVAILENLPTNLRTTYVAWTTGQDVRNMLSRRTFYRYRRQLLELASVDIAIPPPTAPTAQLLPFKRVLEARPAGRPDWADRIDAQLTAGGAVVLPFAA